VIRLNPKTAGVRVHSTGSLQQQSSGLQRVGYSTKQLRKIHYRSLVLADVTRFRYLSDRVHARDGTHPVVRLCGQTAEECYCVSKMYATVHAVTGARRRRSSRRCSHKPHGFPVRQRTKSDDKPDLIHWCSLVFRASRTNFTVGEKLANVDELHNANELYDFYKTHL